MWKYIVSIICVYFAASVTLIEELNSWALYLALPLAFILNFTYDKIPTKNNLYFKLFLILLAWICFTYLGSEDIDLANRQIKQLAGVFILTYIFVNMAPKKGMLPLLYSTYFILLIAGVIYAQNHIIDQFFDTGKSRMNDDELNANKIAYYTFYVTFSVFMLGEILKYKLLRNIFKILFLAMIIVTFYVAIYSASRQVLVIQIPFITFLIYFRHFRTQSNTRKVIAIITFVLAGGYIMGSINSMYENSYLKKRTEKNIDEESRPILIQHAIEVGMKHPLMGVGPGNFISYEPTHRFSHCTYSELFANTGLLGLGFFVAIVWFFIKRQYQRFKATHNDMFLYFFVFAVLYAFYQFFYVFYVDMWLMAFFLLVTTHSELYYLKSRQKIKKRLIRKKRPLPHEKTQITSQNRD